MISLRINELAKRYSTKFVFRDLNLEFAGSVLGIAGANGSGKSTFLRTVSGLISSTSGNVEWKLNNESLAPGDITEYLGYAAPYVQLYEELTARENLEFIRELRYQQPCEDIGELQEEFEISPFSESLFGQISSGQQQRVKLAAAVIHRPEILCLDEPGTNLDLSGARIVRKMTARCIEKDGMVIIASNQAAELDECDVVFHIDQQI